MRITGHFSHRPDRGGKKGANFIAPFRSKSMTGKRRRSEEAGRAQFWRGRGLTDFSRSEWESLCDGCGRCCLVKLEDEDTGEVYFTDVGCRLLDADKARCADYGHRSRRVKDCLRLDPAKAATLPWPAADLRLPPAGAGRGPARLAPFGQRPQGKRGRGGRVHPRPGQRAGERDDGRGNGRAHLRLARQGAPGGEKATPAEL